MKEINLSYENGNIFPVYIVRYFRFKNNVYLIYTLQEKDDRDYMKLYVVKVMNELNEKVSQTVRRPDEWKQMKGIVKIILSQIKKRQLTCIEDLDPLELEKMFVYESKSFFIASDLVDILSTDLEKINSNDLLIVNNVSQEDISNADEESIEVLEIDSEIKDIEILELDDDIENNSSEENIEVLEL